MVPEAFRHRQGCPWADTNLLLRALRDTRVTPSLTSYGGFRSTVGKSVLIAGITRRIGVAVPGLSQKRAAARARGVEAAGRAHSTKGTGSALDGAIARYVATGVIPAASREPWAHRYIVDCLMRDIHLVATEVVVADPRPEIRAATSVDDVAIVHADWPGPRAHPPTQKGKKEEEEAGALPCCKVLFIERKSGYDNESINNSGRKRGIPVPPAEFKAKAKNAKGAKSKKTPTLPNTTKFAHQLQAFIAKELFERKAAQMPDNIAFPTVETALVYVSMRRAALRITGRDAGSFMTHARASGRVKTAAQGAQGDGTVLRWELDAPEAWDAMNDAQRSAVVDTILTTKVPRRARARSKKPPTTKKAKAAAASARKLKSQSYY